MDDEQSLNSDTAKKFYPSATTDTKGQKVTNIPQIHRIPVFSPPTDNNNQQATFNNNNSRAPSRPNGTKSTTKPIGTAKKNINMENRLLVKMATMLPNNGGTLESPQGRLPESRMHLMKVHTELDEMMKDIRKLDLSNSKYSFVRSMDDSFSNEIAQVTNENGNILYDVIIADLSSQAFRKVLRIKNFYQHYLDRVNHDHHNDLQQLQFQIQELKSLLHEQQLLGSSSTTCSVSNQNQNQSQEIGGGEEACSPSNRVHFDNSPPAEPTTVDMLASDNIQAYVFQRLDNERKVS